MRANLSVRRRRFGVLVADASKLDDGQLLRIVQARQSLTPLARAAALRILIGRAPLEVTRGAVYLERRAYVRAEYGI